MKNLYLITIILFLAACTSKNEPAASSQQQAHEAPLVLTPGNDTIKLPVIIPVGKPQTITIPTKLGSFYTIKTKSGDKKINLLPPEVKPLPVVVTNLQSSIVNPKSSIVNLPDQDPSAQG
ncbi:MAG: hypothetical protein COX70_00575, partial [Flavobacteriales bacterium CG_4_10_14_0_2_um_filter_32_8]